MVFLIICALIWVVTSFWVANDVKQLILAGIDVEDIGTPRKWFADCVFLGVFGLWWYFRTKKRVLNDYEDLEIHPPILISGEAPNFCPGCGMKLQEVTAYCAGCGRRIAQ